MMKERKLASPGPEDAVMRDHSPYCESNSPIIQEGFVAQRIRALQELQTHALAGNRSHSPLIPCPPRSVRSYEPLSPPKPSLAPRPAVKVLTVSDYRAIKHHWASMVERPSDDMIECPKLNAARYLQGRRSQRPPVSAKSTQGTAMNIEKPAESRVIGSDEPHAVSTYNIEAVGSRIEQSTDNQDVVQNKLRTTPAKTIQGNESAMTVSHNGQEIGREEPQNGPTGITRSFSPANKSPASNRRCMPDKADSTSRMSSHGDSVADGESACSRTTKPAELLSPCSRQNSPRRNAPKSSEHEIIGPGPVPASLVDPLVLSRCISPRKPQDSDPNHEHEQQQTSQQRHKSVADKLSFLVERGWVGCDVFGKVDNPNVDSGGLWTTSHADGDKADSQCVSSNQGPNFPRAQVYKAHSPIQSTNAGNASHKFEEHDTSHMAPIPRKFKRRENNSSETFSSESSHVGPGSVKTSVSFPTSRRRVFSLQHLSRLRRSNSEGIELHNLSRGSTANGRRNLVTTKWLSQAKVSPELNPMDIMPSHRQDRTLSGSASPDPRTRYSSTSRNEYIRSGSRSTSWFRKSWLKTLLGDGKSMGAGDPLKNHPRSTFASASTDSAQQDSSSLSRQHMMAQPDQSGESEDALGSTTIEPATKEPKPQESKTVTPSLGESDLALKRQGQRITHRDQALLDSSPVAPFPALSPEPLGGTLKQHSHKDAQNPSGQSQKSMTSLCTALPSRRSSEPAATASKSASVASRDPEDSPHTPRGQSSSISQTPRQLSPLSSTSISVRINKSSRLPQVPLGYASGGPNAVSIAEQLQRQALEKEAAYRGLGRGRALKKIQVVVSFDGAEDLIIEATAGGNAVQGSY